MAVSPSHPGPGPNDIPGSVGSQCLSTKRNGPKASFSQADRFRYNDEQLPGPGTYETTNVESMGKAKISLAKGSPSWSLGAKLESSVYSSMPLDVPGAQYDAHKTVEFGGPLNMSHSAAMDKAARSSPIKDNGVPGPGFYKAQTSIGPQKLSQNKNEPTVKFSKKLKTMDMPNGDPVFISRQHGSDRLGRQSPGPNVHVGQLTTDGSTFIGGKSKSVGFTREKKLRPQSTEGFWNPDNPGPGSYKTSSSLGKQTLSKNPTAGSAHKTTMERGVWDKQFLSSDHLKVEAQGRDSPGPMYEPTVTSKGGGMLASSKRGAPFGKGTRDATQTRVVSPGPAAYSIYRDFDERPKSALAKLVGRSSEKGVVFSTESRSCLTVISPSPSSSYCRVRGNVLRTCN